MSFTVGAASYKSDAGLSSPTHCAWSSQLTRMDSQTSRNIAGPFRSVYSSMSLTSTFFQARKSGHTPFQKPSFIPSPPGNQGKTWFVFTGQ